MLLLKFLDFRAVPTSDFRLKGEGRTFGEVRPFRLPPPLTLSGELDGLAGEHVHLFLEDGLAGGIA